MSEAVLAPVPFVASRAEIRHPFRRLLKNPLGLVSLVILATIVLTAIFAPWIAPFDPNATRVELTNAPPFTTEYILGGDSAGRDVLSRLIWATRGTLLASITVLMVSVLVGGVSGLLAGYYSGPAKTVASWVSDVLLALPGVVLLIALYAVIGPNILLAMAIYGFMVAGSPLSGSSKPGRSKVATAARAAMKKAMSRFSRLIRPGMNPSAA